MERFLRSLCELAKPWWLAVVTYVAVGILLIIAGTTETDKTMALFATVLGGLFLLFGIFIVVMRPSMKK